MMHTLFIIYTMYVCLNADEGVKIDKFQKALRQYELLRNQGEMFDNRNLIFKGFLSMINKHSNYSQLLLREKKHWSDGIQKEIWEKT